MSVIHYHAPREKETRKELVNYVNQFMSGNTHCESHGMFQKKLDAFRQAVYLRAIADERERVKQQDNK